MKSLLVISSALALSLSASAQSVQRFTKADIVKQTMEKRLATKHEMSREQAAHVSKAKAPRKSFATNMYYGRPEGTFYNTLKDRNRNSYCYLVFPNFTDVTFWNMTDEARKAETTWSFEGTAVEGDENNNLVEMYNVPSGRLYPVPTLSLDNESFTIGEDFNFAQVGVISTDSLMEFTKWDTEQGGTYTGYEDGSYGFGTGSRTFDFDGDEVGELVYSDGLIEIFEKPASPLYLSSILMPVVSNKLTREEAFPDGKELSVKIVKVTYNEEGLWELSDDVLAEMTVTPDNFVFYETFAEGDGSYGYLDIAQVTVDAFGSESIEPVVIEDEFAVVIDGWGQEGMDLGLFFGDAGTATYDYPFMSPTFEKYYDAETKEYKGNLRAKGIYGGSPYCYNAVMYLNGMFDVAFVSETHRDMVAPVEGGLIETKAEFLEDEEDPETAYHANTIEVYCTLPWYSTWEGMEGADNYFVAMANEEEEPADWIEISAITDQYFAQYSVNVVQITAAALPEDVEGRSVELRIVSDKGASSDVITVTQGNVKTTIKGDVNGDNAVNVADISAIISVMAGTADYAEADVNGDGAVNVADISTVITIMAGGN